MTHPTPESSEVPGSEHPAVARSLVSLTVAIGLTAAAFALPGWSVLPILAFTAWALLMCRSVIELPLEFGLLPTPVDEEEPGRDRPAPDGGPDGP